MGDRDVKVICQNKGESRKTFQAEVRDRTHVDVKQKRSKDLD